jgi:hypothetical protein
MILFVQHVSFGSGKKARFKACFFHFHLKNDKDGIWLWPKYAQKAGNQY